MKRIRIHRPGGYDRLRVEQVDDPHPASGQVRIAVEACGVNYADGIVRMGLYASARELHGYPITPGFEVAGRIDAVGAGVAPARLGEAVIGLTLFNGYSSMVCVDATQAFPLPAGLSMAQGASLPTVFLTAWFMVHQQLHPRSGERWLVHSAAGGVGSALVQLGRLAGCAVTGVVGAAHKIEYCFAWALTMSSTSRARRYGPLPPPSHPRDSMPFSMRTASVRCAVATSTWRRPAAC